MWAYNQLDLDLDPLGYRPNIMPPKNAPDTKGVLTLLHYVPG